MSVEYDRSKFLRSSGAPCRVLLGRAYAAEHPRTVLGNLLRISTLYKPTVGSNERTNKPEHVAPPERKTGVAC